jgi:hypothetical protein
MQNACSSSELPSNAAEGWVVEDSAAYQFLVGHDPPRPGSFLRQLKADAQRGPARRCWATAGGTVGIGVAAAWLGAEAGGPLLALPGLALALVGGWWLTIMLRLFLAAVRTFRRGPLLRGEICALGPHPMGADGYSAAEARLADGRSLRVSVPTAPVAALLGRDGRVEVLLLAALDGRQGCVIGLRALPGGQSDSVAGVCTRAE